LDRLLATGIDLGPLMGMPVAVKDLFTVSGMPTKAGRSPHSDLVQPEEVS
jgi:aspartyl-tRNA(Asn)/glutamyl-tRNA(Gln) amidotransferase subunit A